MIDQVDQRLSQWVATIVEDVPVTFAIPKDAQPGRGVSLYLCDMAGRPAARSERRPPLQILVRYVVSAWAEQAETAHRIVGELMFAAMQQAEFEVPAEAVAPGLWRALGVPPRPAFLLGVLLRRERPEARATLVRQPLVLGASPLGNLSGRVVGPGALPVPGARVEVPSLQRSTRTDADGRFRFGALPIEPPITRVDVSAKGRRISIDPRAAVASGEPLTIELQPTEE
jgi:hypothetical protein